MAEVAADSTGLVGQCVAERYALEERIGTGATGDTYRAKYGEQRVAVKVFHDDVRDDFMRQRRFELEASKLSGLSHPSLPAILGFGVHDGNRFIVREWLAGETLAERLQRGPLSLETALSIARQLLAALAGAHDAKLPHRNLHPSNVFLEERKHGPARLKLIDFAPSRRAPRRHAAAFMPPEQSAGARLDARSDIFAVGTILSAMLRPPRPGALPGSASASRPLQPQAAAHASDPYGTQGALASAAVVAVLSTTAPGNAAATAPVTAPTSGIASARATCDSQVESETAGDANDDTQPELSANARSARAAPDRGALVSAFDHTFAPPVVETPKPVLPPEPGPATPLLLWIQRATDRDRSERFSDAADALRELIDQLPRNLRDVLDAPHKPRPLAAARAAPERAAAPFTVLDSPSVPAPTTSTERTALSPVAKSLLPTAPPPGGSASSLPEVSPIALHAQVEPGTTQLTAATAIGAFTFAAIVVFSMPGEFGRASRDVPRAWTHPTSAATAPAPVRPKPIATPLPLAPIALSAIAVTPSAPQPIVMKPSPGVAKIKLARSAPTRDPWLDPVPKDLQRFRAQATSGAAGDKAAIESLRVYNRDHANDPRGYLITARFYLNRLWRNDAVTQYAAALARDPSARGAPEVLPALLECVGDGKASGPAEALIEKVWGTSATPSIDQALDRVRSQAAALRLSALSERLIARAP